MARRPAKIVSGGQTGVDRGALDAAIAMGVEHGGWCPRARLAEDGRVPDRYDLQETESSGYAVRTEQNVVDSDATLILCRGVPRGGTELTLRMTQKHGRPCLVVDLDDPPPPNDLCDWWQRHAVQVLNVAGPRDSQCPGIAATAEAFLIRAFESSCGE